MNKPLPWNVKGVGFDAREAARLAAKRAGVPLGEWLNGVISARAAELGVQVEDVEPDDRLEAIAARLSDADLGTAAAMADHEAPMRRAEPAMAGGDPFRAAAPHQARFAIGDDAPARMVPQPMRASTLPRQADAPLSLQARFGGAMSPMAEPAMASGAAMPQRVAARQPQIAPATRTEPVPSTKGDRLDDRLNAILAKLNRSFEAAAEASETLAGPESAKRQVSAREVELASAAPTPTSRPAEKTMAVEPGTSAGRELPKQETSGLASFADLQGAFRSLAEKLEAQLGEEKDDHRARPAPQATRGDMARTARTQGRADTAQRVGEIRTLQRELAQLAADVAELTPHRHLASLEAAVRELVGRTDLSRLDGVQASVLAPVERLGQEMREAIRATDATAAVEAVRRDMKALSAKLNAPAASGDANALEALRVELGGLRGMVGTLADRLAASERLGDEIAALGSRVATIADRGSATLSRDLTQAIGEIRESLQAFQPHAGLGVIDKKIDHLSARIETMAEARDPEAYFTDVMRQINQAHEALASRLSGRTAPRADLSGIEESLGSLSAKIDSIGRSSQDVNALYGLVGNLADRMQEARDPQADTPAFTALQAQIGQLVERLDRSETDNATLHGLERLIGDLFLQIEQSRNVAIDAAENAARAAAQDTLRAAMDNPSLNGAELTMQTGLDVDHVSQELAELRRIQETADRRITTTLTALNSTLERLVDHMVAAPAAAPVTAAVPPSEEPLPTETLGRRRRRVLPESLAAEAAIASELPPFDPEQFLIEPGNPNVRERAKGVLARNHDDTAAAPVPHIGSDGNASVAPLIAAARRAAQAAQESALETSLKPGGEGADSTIAGQPGKARSFFANRRRPLLLALAGVVLLLGTLQIVRLSGEQPTGGSVSAPVVETPGPVETPPPTSSKPDKGAALTPAPVVPNAASASPQGAAPAQVAAATDPAPTGSLPQAVPAADLTPLAGLGQGLKDLAAGGDAGAQFEVASRLADGRGVTRDAKASAAWFERAAKKGLAPAQYRVGSVYEKGVGVTADPALAIAWYEKAAAQGNIRAMHNLAVMSAEGAGAKPDYGKAVSWFTKAASYGVRDSQYNLAVLFARGLGVPQNLGQSYAWFALAAQQGDTDAVSKRDTVAAKLDAKSLADAKAVVASFHPLASNSAANDVAAPAGGWDAALPAKTTAARKVDSRVSRM